MSSPEPFLYVVATPIGNLEDITLRAIRILREVDFIICEDTRRTLKLLNYYSIKKPLMSYFAPKEKEKAKSIVNRLKKGQTAALVTDAGTPLVSDPGTFLIKKCVEEEISVIPIPGPSSLTAAVSVSILAREQIHFIGFPKKRGLKNFLISLSFLEGVLVFFERAERVKKLIRSSYEIFGDRRVEIHRELTKIHEEILRGYLSDFFQWDGKGEVVVVIEGCRDVKKQIRKIEPETLFSALGFKKKYKKSSKKT